MTKLKTVNLFAVNKSHGLQSSWFTISSNDHRFLSAYKMFVKKIKFVRYH